MEKVDAIYTLERLAHTEAKWPGTEETLEALDMAVKAIRLIATVDHFPDSTKMIHDSDFVDTNKMVPLTLEQLRGMGGEPVYLKNFNTKFNNGWHILKGITKDEIKFRFEGYMEAVVKTELLGVEFNLYSYPPAHIDQEAWDPCGELCRNNCMTCDHNADELFGDEDYCKDCHRYSKWESSVHKYCERCGRPKTPDAWAELEKRLRRWK